MTGIEALPGISRVLLYVLLTLIALLTVVVAWAQFWILKGRAFNNPDGTVDDWREQRIFYGIAWADLTVAIPMSVVGLLLIVPAPLAGLVLLFGVAAWMVWSNVMTTVTSLRFAQPRITLQWLVVFPFGALVGLAYLAWIAVHFDALYG